MFALPPDVPVEEEEEPFADYQPPSGVGWQVAGAAAGAAANALGFALRHAPRRKSAWPTDDDEPGMPGDAVLAPEDWEQRQPPDDRTVNLLHRTGLAAPALTAEVDEWIDALPWIQNVKALQEKLPASLEGIFGPGAVWDALGERAAEDGLRHRVARLAVRIPDGYRVEYLSGDYNKRYKAIACDGEHTTKLFDLCPLDETTSFRIVPWSGMRSVTESGGPLGDLGLPRPAEAAATAAATAGALAAAGAVAVTGWLEKHRARRERR